MQPKTTAVNVTATGTTGGTCQKSGPYKSSTAIVVFFKGGDRFPTDPTNGRSTSWTMVSN